MFVSNRSWSGGNLRHWSLALVAAFFMSGAAPAAFAGEPIGACCVIGAGPSCQEVGPSTCSTLDGSYQGDGSTCSTPGICGAPECGDSTVEIPEECDDGNTVSGDGCTEGCILEFCGDGTVNNNPLLSKRSVLIGEQCDDGNTINGDGCDSSCQIEYCGDSIVNNDGAEACDDGNTSNGDGCNDNCQTEFCGDETINNNGETCDDGNSQAGDGCSDTCQSEFCGDETINNNGETCDDGNSTAGDGCSENCQIEFCGDSTINNNGETCDDGNSIAGDGCSDTCQSEFCGDGTVNNNPLLDKRTIAGEQCDDGNTNDNDGCNSICQTEFCGDAIVQDGIGEECEDGNTNDYDDCVGCKAKACGDGFLDFQSAEPNEQCDDNNNVDGDGCSGKCEDEFCGDGIVNDDNGETTEECDDANTDDNDSCLTNCVSATCGDDIVNISNGKTLEQCDDGNTTDGDGCDANCNLETGACCYGSSCQDDVTSGDCEGEFGGTFAGNGSLCSDPGVCVNCGDGSLQFGETCDDGNSAVGDGCDGSCEVEPCWTCDGGPVSLPRGVTASTCTPDDSQSCDDGDNCTLGDQCSAGSCVGNPPIIPAACEWVMTAGNDTRVVQSRTRDNVIVHGDICGGSTRIGNAADIQGDVVATATGGKGSQFGVNALVTGDIVTGGSAISGRPNGVILPGLATDVVPAGTATTQTDDSSRELDATGTNPRVGDCQDAIDSIVPSTNLLDALPGSGSPLGKVNVKGSLTITATSPIHVVDFDRLIAGNKATITLDGAGIPDVSFILRVKKKVYLHLQTEIVLAGGATAERVILYGGTRCKIGQLVIGSGTVFCPHGKLKVDIKTIWDGALISGKQRIDLRHQADLFHVPLLIGAP